jgi:hypothetical protein
MLLHSPSAQTVEKQFSAEYQLKIPDKHCGRSRAGTTWTRIKLGTGAMLRELVATSTEKGPTQDVRGEVLNGSKGRETPPQHKLHGYQYEEGHSQ